jgi:hypothetical protein
MQKNLKLLNERLCQKIQEFHDRRQADLARCVARLHTEVQSIDKFVGDSKHLLIDVNVQVIRLNTKTEISENCKRVLSVLVPSLSKISKIFLLDRSIITSETTISRAT